MKSNKKIFMVIGAVVLSVVALRFLFTLGLMTVGAAEDTVRVETIDLDEFIITFEEFDAKTGERLSNAEFRYEDFDSHADMMEAIGAHQGFDTFHVTLTED